MLEQQQIYLVNGLQELYHRLLKGEKWQDKPLRCKSNRLPLIHDILTQLGALDQSKHEKFIENTDAMQQELWKKNIKPAQHQETDISKNAHSPITPPQLSNPFDSCTLSQTPITFGIDSPQSITKSEQHMITQSPAYVAPMQTMTEPCLMDSSDLDLQNAQLPTMQFPPSPDFEKIGGIDIISHQYSELLCDDSITWAMFDRQTAMGNKNSQFRNRQLESAS